MLAQHGRRLQGRRMPGFVGERRVAIVKTPCSFESPDNVDESPESGALVAVNLDKPQRWKADVASSVDFYNAWFLEFAPKAFRSTRVKTTADVERALDASANLARLESALLRKDPGVLPTLRMSTCPPLAVDRLIGLAGVSPNLVRSMERDKRLPPEMDEIELARDLEKIASTLKKMADPDIFVWLERGGAPSRAEVYRAATIVADRLCGAEANPIIRNAQEDRQLAAVEAWLGARGYQKAERSPKPPFESMAPGSFSFRTNVPVNPHGGKRVNIPVDVMVMPSKRDSGDFPILIEAKSAGDYTNTNKRRKEESTKMAQLKEAYGENVRFFLLLCGYFNAGYLGYAAQDGIDWVWEHRLDDLALFGL
jgi:hypothetical protein